MSHLQAVAIQNLPHSFSTLEEKVAAGRMRFFLAILLALFLVPTTPAHASDANEKLATQTSFDIPSMPLSQALKTLADQAGIQILFEEKIVQGLEAPAIKANQSALHALTTLLTNTGLEYTAKGDTVAVRKKTQLTTSLSRNGRGTEGEGSPANLTSADSSLLPEREKVGVARMRVAQNDQDSKDEDVSSDTSEEKSSGIPEILVVGTRSLNTDIRRSEDAAQPYMVFDRETIERSGANSIEDFLRQRLTASTSTQTTSQIQGITGAPNSTISLRGLGSDETLILIDGRRAANATSGSQDDSGNGQPDLNGIPLAAIERIEVLPTTASGIYGGGATGGVINVVLRRDYSGFETKLTYESAFDTNAGARRIDMSAGFNLEEGRTNILLSASYSDRAELTLGDRQEFEQRARARFQANGSYLDPGLFIVPASTTTNIRTLGGEDLTLLDGTSLGSNITFVPIGYEGVDSDNGAALVANAGRHNLELADTAAGGGARQTLFNPPIVKALMGTVRREFTPHLTVFLELSASENSGRSVGNNAGLYFLFPGDPGNPFNETVVVNAPGIGADRTNRVTLENQRAVTGAILQLPRRWTAGLDYAWSRSHRAPFSFASFDSSSAGAAAGAGDFDLFRDFRQDPPDLTPFFADPNTGSASENTLGDATLRLSGPLPFSAPGGAPTLSMLLEHRRETFGEIRTAFPLFAFETLVPERSQDVMSAYLETVIPLVGSGNRMRGLEELEVQLAGRWDEYRSRSANSILFFGGVPSDSIVRESNRVSSVDPTVGVKFKPLQDLMLRASYGTGFLPPSFLQVQPLVSVGGFPFFGVTDPLRGDEPVIPLTLIGGGVDLDPEKSESHSVGAVLTPRAIPGLRLAVDWTRIEKTDAIIGPDPTNSQIDLNTLIDFFPERIVRDPDPATFGSFGVGPIVQIDRSLLNFARAEVRALDFSVDYAWQTERWGEFALSSNATRLQRATTQSAPIAPVVDQTGVGSFFGGNLRWRANAGLDWDYGPWTAGWRARYYSGYFIKSDRLADPLSGETTVPSQIYHDARVGYRFGSGLGGWVNRLDVSLGIENVFDEEPPFDPLVTSFYSPYGDPMLRSYSLSITAGF